MTPKRSRTARPPAPAIRKADAQSSGVVRRALGGGSVLAAAVCTAVWFWGAHAKTEDELAARSTAGRLLSAVSDWKRNATLQGCPTISQLQVDRQLERNAQTQDPWGQRFRILCTDVGVSVLSAGADRQFQTGDDIRLAEDEQS